MEAPGRSAIRQAFARTVRELRTARGIAQEALAYESGVDRGYLGGLERAEHSPTLETIYKLLPILELSFTEFASVYDRTLRRELRHPRSE